MKQLKCSCKCILPKNHKLGESKCFRTECKGEEIPHNFRTIRCWNVCDIGNETYNVHDVKQEMNYEEHENGRWSKPKTDEEIEQIKKQDQSYFEKRLR